MTTLMCDYDGEIPADVGARLEFVVRAFRLVVEWYRLDRTRHGYHMIVVCRNRYEVEGMRPLDIVLAQALLGSDWKRETFNLIRVKSLSRFSPLWRQRWNVLFHRHYRRVSLCHVH